MRLCGNKLVTRVPFPVTHAKQLVIAGIRAAHAFKRKTDLIGIAGGINGFGKRESRLVQRT